LFQSDYVDKFFIGDNNIMKTPMDISVYLSKKYNGINQLKYSRIIESLINVINYTRSDIAYLVSKLSRFSNKLSMNNWKAIKGYLTLDYVLHYTGYPIVLERYSNAN
jgi:hypothetical protein